MNRLTKGNRYKRIGEGRKSINELGRKFSEEDGKRD